MKQSKEIQHLYWRAGFGLSPQEWTIMKNWSRESAIKDLFSKAKSPTLLDIQSAKLFWKKDMDEAQKKELKKLNKAENRTQSAAWVARMADPSESDLIERMSLFWHGHFACESKIAYLAVQQLNVFRQYALGNFRDLVLAIAKDPSMIRYLNNQQNRKKKPNENFARELLELFTIGRGNYSEQDIKEAARAFTGWSSDKGGNFIFRERQHDFGQKTFFGKRGNFNGEDIIDLILEQKETAKFIAQKVYKYFVNEQINEARVEYLADVFFSSNYDIEKLMRTIFESDWFYSDENIGTKIKSPVELIAGMMRQLNLKSNHPKGLNILQKALGQTLFVPPNVAGWAGGKNWVDNSTLMLRLNLANAIYQATNPEKSYKKQNLKWLKNMELHLNFEPILNLVSSNRGDYLETLSDFLLQANLSVNEEVIKSFVNKNSKSAVAELACIRLMSLPEYQMC